MFGGVRGACGWGMRGLVSSDFWVSPSFCEGALRFLRSTAPGRSRTASTGLRFPLLFMNGLWGWGGKCRIVWRWIGDVCNSV